MATQATLSDVIDRLRAEGQLTRNTGTNSIKSIRVELSSQTSTLREMLKIMQKQEERFELGRASQDSGGRVSPDQSTVPSDVSGTSVIRRGLAGFMANMFTPALSILGNAIKPLLKPIKSLARLIRVGGPVGIVIGLLWDVFKDIGENENFQNALKTVKEVWNEKILPTFNRIKTLFENFMSSETTSDVVEKLIDLHDRFVTSIQNFVSNSIRILAETVGKITDGINDILDGNFLEGMKKIFGGMLSGIRDSIDNSITEFLRILGIDFGEKGTFFAWITTKAQELWDWITGIFGNITDTVSKQWDVVTGGASIGSWVWSKVKGIWDWMSEKFSGAAEFIGVMWNIVTNGETSIGGWIWDKISGVWDWMLEKFSGAAEFIKTSWGIVTNGVTSIGSWIWGKIEGVWNWMKGIFPGATEFIKTEWDRVTNGVTSIGSWIWGKVEGVWNWIKDMFDDLLGMFPTIDELRQSLLSGMPDWMRRLVGAPERTTDEIIADKAKELGPEYIGTDETAEITAARMEIARLKTQREELINDAAMSGVPANTTYYDDKIADYEKFILMNSYQNGTRGFMDFGPGTLAMLHGIEAVVPRDTLAGQFLANNFDENFNPIMRRIASVETAAIQQTQSPTIVVNAPTVAPVRQTVGGSTTVNTQRVTAYGTGSTSTGLGGFAQ